VSPTDDQQRDQMARALSAIRKVERRSAVLPRGLRTPLKVRGWEASDGNAGDFSGRIPVDTTLPPPDGPTVVVHAATAAGLVRLSKFSAAGAIRARAFYPSTTPPMTLKLVLATGNGRAPIIADVAARTALGDRLPAPPLLDSGVYRSMAYLVEPIVFGHHPGAGREKSDTAGTLIRGLLAAHRVAGLRDEPPRLNPLTFERLADLFTQVEWSPTWPAPDALTRECRQIVESGSTEAIGWCHGDLVYSNVIIGEDGAVHLVDWEHARIGPVAADFAKLISATYDPNPALSVLEESVTGDDIGPRPGRHSLRHQLAISVMRYLSWSPPKRERAASAGRAEIYDRGVQRSIDLLVELL